MTYPLDDLFLLLVYVALMCLVLGIGAWLADAWAARLPRASVRVLRRLDPAASPLAPRPSPLLQLDRRASAARRIP